MRRGGWGSAPRRKSRLRPQLAPLLLGCPPPPPAAGVKRPWPRAFQQRGGGAGQTPNHIRQAGNLHSRPCWPCVGYRSGGGGKTPVILYGGALPRMLFYICKLVFTFGNYICNECVTAVNPKPPQCSPAPRSQHGTRPAPAALAPQEPPAAAACPLAAGLPAPATCGGGETALAAGIPAARGRR